VLPPLPDVSGTDTVRAARGVVAIGLGPDAFGPEIGRGSVPARRAHAEMSPKRRMKRSREVELSHDSVLAGVGVPRATSGPALAWPRSGARAAFDGRVSATVKRCQRHSMGGARGAVPGARRQSCGHAPRRVVRPLLIISASRPWREGRPLGQVRAGLFQSDAFAARLARALNDPRGLGVRGRSRSPTSCCAEKPTWCACGRCSGPPPRASSSTTRSRASRGHRPGRSPGDVFARGRNLLSVPDVGAHPEGGAREASPTLAARVPRGCRR
jgi:hypothetical protein